MAQTKTSPASLTVRNSRTGKYVTVKGAGSMKGSELTIKRGVDLTKPIAMQTMKNIRTKKAK